MSDKVNDFIKDEFNKIDSELKRDESIKEQADDIARILIKTPKTKISFNGKVIALALTYEKNEIRLLFLSDETMRKAMILSRPPTPGLIKGYYNDEFTEHENLVAVVEGFLLHELGEIKVSSQDDGIAKIAREKDFK